MITITKDQADRIVESNDAFKKKINIIDGYEIVQYTYNLASYSDFNDPIPGSGLQAFDLRGIAFVKNGDSWDRFVMLHKFFSVNQTIGYMYGDLKDQPVIRSFDKEDGSLIRFIRLPNGKVLAKSKFDVTSDQANKVNEWLKDKNFFDFINATIDSNKAALFELTGPDNKVVLKYNEESLNLIQIRDENTGEYEDPLSNDLVIKYGISTTKQLEPLGTVGEYLELAKHTRDIEGWVVQLPDTMCKIKTDWYLNLHGMMQSVEGQEHKLIKTILNDSVGELIDLASLGKSTLKYINDIEQVVRSEYNNRVRHISDVISSSTKMTKKDLALSLKGDRDMPIILRAVSTNLQDSDICSLVEIDIIKSCKTAEKAQKYLNNLGISKKCRPTRML